jgi:hypothetical protein
MNRVYYNVRQANSSDPVPASFVSSVSTGIQQSPIANLQANQQQVKGRAPSAYSTSPNEHNKAADEKVFEIRFEASSVSATEGKINPNDRLIERASIHAELSLIE